MTCRNRFDGIMCFAVSVCAYSVKQWLLIALFTLRMCQASYIAHNRLRTDEGAHSAHHFSRSNAVSAGSNFIARQAAAEEKRRMRLNMIKEEAEQRERTYVHSLYSLCTPRNTYM